MADLITDRIDVDTATRNAIKALIAARKHTLRLQIHLWIDAKGSEEAFEKMVEAFDGYKFAVKLHETALHEGFPF